MKVFNWVHRKFLHVHIKSDATFMQEDGKRSSKKMDFEMHALLERDDHDGVANWENGILSIGTLGIPIGPLEEKTQTQCNLDETIKEILAPRDAESNHDLVHHLHDDHKDDDHENIKNQELLFEHEMEKLIGGGCKEIEEVVEDDTINAIELKESNASKKKVESQVSRRRVTLADLFLEDSDHAHQHIATLREGEDDEDECGDSSIDIHKPTKIRKKKITTLTKNGFIKAKKLLKDDFRPLDMFNQLMGRIIKKKVHPDMEGKMQKDIEMEPTNKEIELHDSTSLSLIQDVMA